MPPIYPARRYEKKDKVYAYNRGLTPLQKKQCQRIAKYQVNKGAEPKRIVFSGTASVQACSAYLLNPLYGISQGGGVRDRIGNIIHLDSITIRLRLSVINKETQFFVFAYWGDVETVTAGGTPTQVTSPNIQTTIPLLGSVVVGQGTLQVLDKFQCVKLRDSRFAVPVHVTSVNGECEKTFDIKFKNKKVGYLLDTASYMDGKNLYWGLIGDQQGATIDSTIVATMSHTTEVRFHD